MFSVISFGIFEIYWFYRNWKIVKEAEGTNISPFWRAIFTPLFVHQLFKKIFTTAEQNEFGKNYSIGLLAWTYIVLVVAGNASARATDGATSAFLFILSFFSVIPLLSVQKAINFSNKKINPEFKTKDSFSGVEIVIIIVGGALLLLSVIGTLSSTQTSSQQSSQTSTVLYS